MSDTALKNGAGAAAVLAAGVGCFALAVLAVAGDKIAAVKSALNVYKPTGPLSGVSTGAVVVWLGVWAVLEWRWRGRDVAMGRVAAVALGLLALGVLLTFPPIGDLF